MRLSRFFLGLGAASVVAAPPLAAQDRAAEVIDLADFNAPALAGSSDWALDYGDEYCALTRAFGEGEQQVTLRIFNFGNVGSYLAMLSGPSVPGFLPSNIGIALRLGGNAAFTAVNATTGKAGEDNAVSFPVVFHRQEVLSYLNTLYANSPYQPAPIIPPDTQFERAATSIDLQMNRTPMTLQTGSMHAPLTALRDCQTDLITHWGLDPQIQQTLSRKAAVRESTVRRIIARYPSRALRDRQSAFVPVRVIVGADGRPEGCTPQLPVPDPSFAEAACEGMESRFDPALDANGEPVRSIFQTNVLYVLN